MTNTSSARPDPQVKSVLRKTKFKLAQEYYQCPNSDVILCGCPPPPSVLHAEVIKYYIGERKNREQGYSEHTSLIQN